MIMVDARADVLNIIDTHGWTISDLTDTSVTLTRNTETLVVFFDQYTTVYANAEHYRDGVLQIRIVDDPDASIRLFQILEA
jgi:hypothetical protein